MLPRFHFPTPGLLAIDACVELPPPAAHHAARVLRLRSGDGLSLFDGDGGQWRGEIESVAAGAVCVRVREFIADPAPSLLQITLAQALPASDKMDWVVEKCVELGVTAIQPLFSRRSVLRLAGERLARREAHWRRVSIAACEQCGRNRPPLLAPTLDFPRFLTQARAHNGPKLILSPQGETNLRRLPPTPASVLALVGPESGWHDSEVQAAQEAGFATMRLGPRVLRSETAGVALVAALQATRGDLQGEDDNV